MSHRGVLPTAPPTLVAWAVPFSGIPKNFWRNYQSLQMHIPRSCFSDEEGSLPIVKAIDGTLLHPRGTNHNEAKRSSLRRDFAYVSRASCVVFDARCVWRRIYSIRRLFSRACDNTQCFLANIPIPMVLDEARGRLHYDTVCDGIKLSDEPGITPDCSTPIGRSIGSIRSIWNMLEYYINL